MGDKSSDEEIVQIRPAQRRSTMPARVTNSPPQSAMRHAHGTHSARESRRRFVVWDDRPAEGSAGGGPPNPPIIINNYVGADSSDAESYHGRTRSRRRSVHRSRGEEDDEELDVRVRRHRYRSPISVVQSSSTDSGSDESEDELYNFTPSYASVSSESIGEREPSVDSAAPFLPAMGASPTRSANVMHIYKSQYTGDASQDGDHTSKLTLLHEPRHPQQALFRWIHIEQPVMSFEGFWDEVAGITSLTNSEKSGIRKLLQDVRSRGIRRFVTAYGSSKIMQTRGLQSRKLQTDDSEASASRQRTVYWMSLPFFELKKYSPVAHPSEAFPSPSLMQADYSQHLMARDMQQAVRQINGCPEEHCFHVSQLWALVLDNSLLVTCSTLSAKSLGKDRLHFKEAPPKEKASDSSEPRILVEYGENILWAIPVSECQSWFAFITHFWEFWPNNIQFYRHRKPLPPSDWPDIVASARHGTGRITLEAAIKPSPSPPTRGVLAPIDEPEIPTSEESLDPTDGSSGGKSSTKKNPDAPKAAAASTSSDQPARELHDFSVFTWIQPVPGVSRTVAAQAELGRIDHFMSRKTRRNDQRAYKECIKATHDEVRSELQRLVDRGILQQDRDSRLKASLQDRLDTFNAAVVVFRFFLPLGFDSPTIRKFWGGLSLLLDRPWPKEFGGDESVRATKEQRTAALTLYSARKDLRRLTRHVRLFQRIMCSAPDLRRMRIEIPAQLIQAFIYIVLSVVQASLDTGRYMSHMDNALDLLRTGMRAILKSASPMSLLTYSSVLPTHVLSLISLKLLNDVTGSLPDINSVYSEWIKTLENEIETKPALAHQEKIQWLISEISIILDNLGQQISIINGLLRPGPQSSASRAVVPPYTSPYSRHHHDYSGPSYVEQQSTAVRTRTRKRTRTRSRSRSPEDYSYGPLELRSINIGNRGSSRVVYPADDLASMYSVDRAGDDEADDAARLSATDPRGFRDLLAWDCRCVVEQRLAEFAQFKRRAQALQQTNTHKTEERKDYHDQAVYAFTIVTVVFLPLSAISSIFGMNTSDIRDLDQGQWLYWATAVPVTAGVILIGLWWMGELGNAALWLLNLRNNGRGAAGGGAGSTAAWQRPRTTPRAITAGHPVRVPYVRPAGVEVEDVDRIEYTDSDADEDFDVKTPTVRRYKVISRSRL